MVKKDYFGILAFIALNRCIGKETLLVYIGDRSRRDRFVKKAIKEGHVKSRTIKVRKQNEKKQETFFVITKAGLYDLTQCGTDSWWSQVIPEAYDSFRLFEVQERRQEGYFRLLRKTSVLTMAESAGAYIPIEAYTEVKARAFDFDDLSDQEDAAMSEITWPEFLRNNLSQESYEKHSFLVMNNSDERLSSFAVFHSAMSMKTEIAKSVSHITSADVQRGRDLGISDSHVKSLRISAVSTFGMSWNEWMKKPENNAYAVWSKAHAVASQSQLSKSGWTAALLVKNPRQFASLYHDSGEGEDAQHDISKNSFGGDFAHFYIIPVSNEGVIHLKQLLFNSEPELMASIIDSAVTALGYTRSENQPQRKKCFSLVSPEGDEVSVGFMNDAKTMLQIEAAALAEPDKNFGVLCYEWQLPYYEKIMPGNVWYVTYPNPKET